MSQFLTLHTDNSLNNSLDNSLAFFLLGSPFLHFQPHPPPFFFPLLYFSGSDSSSYRCLYLHHCMPYFLCLMYRVFKAENTLLSALTVPLKLSFAVVVFNMVTFF